jgi:tripartite-type tricarboxylate transporter receptor subunit TctC
MVIGINSTRRTTMKKRVVVKGLLLGILFMFVLASLTVVLAAEKKFPSRYIEVYHGFPPGGPVEVQNRLLVQSLEKQLGSTVVSIGKPGGGGVVATTALINAAPDGYTLMNSGFNSIVQTILASNGTFTLDHVKIIGQWNLYGAAFCVPIDSQWKTYKDFIDFAKKNPGVHYAHAGVGTANALRMESINKTAKLMLTPVPFKGDGEVVAALLGKHVPAGLLSIFSAKAQVDAGKLRVLFSLDHPATFGLDPKTPTIDEIFDKSVTDKDIKVVGFLIAPQKTPDDIAKILESALQKACKDQELIDGMAKAGMAVDFHDSKAATQNLRRIMETVKANQQ